VGRNGRSKKIKLPRCAKTRIRDWRVGATDHLSRHQGIPLLPQGTKKSFFRERNDEKEFFASLKGQKTSANPVKGKSCPFL